MVYENGLVTLESGVIICQTGGLPCLYEYLSNKYPGGKNITVIPQPEKTANFNSKYTTFIDKAGKVYWYFNNGTLYSKDAKTYVSDFDQVKALFNGLIYVGSGVVAETKIYTEYLINGYTDVASKYPLYSVHADGSVWYQNSEFLTFGGVEGLINFLLARKNLKSELVGSTITIAQLDKTFKIKTGSPLRLTNSQGVDICIENDLVLLQNCLVRVLVDCCLEDLIKGVTPAPDHQIYVDKETGLTYIIYNNGTVTTDGGDFICNTGVPCLIEYLQNL